MGLDSSTRLILIRHGETDWNRAGRIQGHQDVALNAMGQQQAQALAAALDDEPIEALYSSDLLRACQTAEPLAQRRGLVLRRHSGLRERSFGVFEGRHWAQIVDEAPEAAARWRQRDPDYVVGGGESLVMLSERVLQTIDAIARAHSAACIALVTHGGVLDCLFRAASRLDLQGPRSWMLGNATINRLLWTPQGLGLIGWNDDRHLEGLAVECASP